MVKNIYYLKCRFGRFWLNSVASNFNIISKEYDNKKDGILLKKMEPCSKFLISSYNPSPETYKCALLKGPIKPDKPWYYNVCYLKKKKTQLRKKKGKIF